MNNSYLEEKCRHYIYMLCRGIAERCVGSEGNRLATDFFQEEISKFGWKTFLSNFVAFDWQNCGTSLTSGTTGFDVYASPYSLGCSLSAPLVAASTIAELENLDARGSILLLHGEIAKEQLMPKNFVFYNPENHRKIISLLENSGAGAIITATGRNSSLAGGAYPFPMIEDGDFDIPSVYMTDAEGLKLLTYIGKELTLKSNSKRLAGSSCNVMASRGGDVTRRIVVTAHIDAKKGTPGAIDNASGVAVLLLLAELLRDYKGSARIEILALNGEDYYSIPGQMTYIMENHDRFADIMLNINIDGAGYNEGGTAFSFFGLPQEIKQKTEIAMNQFPGITEGEPWPQGDHSIFVHYGVPAIAVTSKWFIDNMSTQDITHTPKDNPSIVDLSKLVTIAKALKMLVLSLS